MTHLIYRLGVTHAELTNLILAFRARKFGTQTTNLLNSFKGNQ